MVISIKALIIPRSSEKSDSLFNQIASHEKLPPDLNLLNITPSAITFTNPTMFGVHPAANKSHDKGIRQ